MNPKRYFAGLAFYNFKATIKFTGMSQLGLILIAFGLPLNGEWLAAALPLGTLEKNRGAALGIDSLPNWSENHSSLR